MASLRPGQIITDKLFDELRYGDTEKAAYINNFGSADSLNAACNEYEERNGPHATKHTIERMYSAWWSAQKRDGKQEKKEVEQKTDELEYARDIQRQITRQNTWLRKKQRVTGSKGKR